jgi:membrane fusion protein (multidrug efflux system)
MQVLFSVTQREMLEGRAADSNGEVRALVRLADGSLYPENARIDFLDVQVNPRTDGQIVRAIFPNPEGILTTGQTVRVIIQEKGGDKVVVIPQSAIATDQTGSSVFVVGDDNKVEQRRIRLGTGREGLAVVDEGLKPGERVVKGPPR